MALASIKASRLLSADVTRSYRNQRQHPRYPKANLTTEDQLVIVSFTARNTTNELQHYALTGLPFDGSNRSVRLLDPLGNAISPDSELNHYIGNNRREFPPGHNYVSTDIRTGQTWSTHGGFEVPSHIPRRDLYVQIEAPGPGGSSKTVLVKLF